VIRGDERRIDLRQRRIEALGAGEVSHGTAVVAGLGAHQPGVVEDRRRRLQRQRALVERRRARQVLALPASQRRRLVGAEAPGGVAHARERRQRLLEVGGGVAEQEQPERGAGLAHVARELGARRLGPRGIGQQPRDAGLAVGRLDPAVFVARDDRHVRPAAPKVDERDVVPVDERPVGRRQRRVGVRAEDVVDGIAGVRRVVDQRGVDAVAGSQPLEVARIGPREVDFLQQAGRHVAAAVHATRRSRRSGRR